MISYRQIRAIVSDLESRRDGSIEWEIAFERLLLKNGWTVSEYYSACAQYITVVPELK